MIRSIVFSVGLALSPAATATESCEATQPDLARYSPDWWRALPAAPDTSGEPAVHFDAKASTFQFDPTIGEREKLLVLPVADLSGPVELAPSGLLAFLYQSNTQDVIPSHQAWRGVEHHLVPLPNADAACAREHALVSWMVANGATFADRPLDNQSWVDVVQPLSFLGPGLLSHLEDWAFLELAHPKTDQRFWLMAAPEGDVLHVLVGRPSAGETRAPLAASILNTVAFVR